MIRILALVASHIAVLGVGFALGIYMLPILTEPEGPAAEVLAEMAEQATYSAELTRDQRGNDRLHWGEGSIHVSGTQVIHQGKLAPGPDYKLYLVKEFAEHEDEFLPIKDTALQVGDVDTFDGFILDLPAGVDTEQYTTVLIWCEAFSEFITSAKYR
ncbi:MAG: DM13 domain-containing protein [Alphaproteobacteria bacterium]